MSPQVPVELKERLCELYIQAGMGSQQTRDFYVSELEAQLEQRLSIARFPEPKRDVWSIINACLARPGALGKLTQVVRSFSRGSQGMPEIEQLVAGIERQTLSSFHPDVCAGGALI